MPQPIAYNTGSQTSGSLKLNGIEYAISSSIVSGSNGQRWFTSVNPGNGIVLVTNSFTQSYSTYQNSTPLFYTASALTDAAITSSINGLPDRFGLPQFTDTASAFAWVADSRKYFMMNYEYPQIVTDGLVFLTDAKFLASYPTTQSTWYDLSGQGSNGSLINGPTFDPNGWLTFDGIDDYISIPNAYSFTTGNGTDYTFEIWFKMRTLPTIQYGPNGHVWGGQNGNNVVIYLNPQSGGVSKGIMIYDDTRYDPSMMTNGGFTADTWAQWVIIGDGTNNTVTHYINGALDRGPTVVQPSSQYVRAWGYGQTKFGFDTRWNTYSTLDLAIARQYTRQLSQTEISQNYYQAPIVTDGLVLAVDAGNIVSYESGSTTTYSLTGSFTGSLQNGVGYSVKNGGAWVFDGVDDRIYYGSQPINFNPSIQPFSMGGWINLSSIAGAGTDAVLLDIVGSSSSGLYIAINKTNLNLRVYIRPPAGATSIPVESPINSVLLGEWVHGIVTFDGGTIKLYQNGELINTATSFTNYPTSLDNWYSGHQDDNNHYMDGYISSVFLYLKTLTAEEVSQNFNAQRSRFGI